MCFLMDLICVPSLLRNGVMDEKMALTFIKGESWGISRDKNII